jgi:predicted RNA-binding protein YlxR (DUF448 family)
MGEATAPRGGEPGGAPPQRTCVGCRRKAGQDELVRVVRRSDGTLRAGRTLPGRGAWLCAESPSCLQRAARRGALSRALRAPVSSEAVLARGWEGLEVPP